MTQINPPLARCLRRISMLGSAAGMDIDVLGDMIGSKATALALTYEADISLRLTEQKDLLTSSLYNLVKVVVDTYHLPIDTISRLITAAMAYGVASLDQEETKDLVSDLSASLSDLTKRCSGLAEGIALAGELHDTAVLAGMIAARRQASSAALSALRASIVAAHQENRKNGSMDACPQPRPRPEPSGASTSRDQMI